MTTKERVSIVVRNIDLVNRQVQENNQKAIAMGRLYNMNLDFAEHCSVALFDAAFDDWYRENAGYLDNADERRQADVSENCKDAVSDPAVL